LAVLPDHQLIILEWVEGVPVSTRLFRHLFRWPSHDASRTVRLAEKAAEALLVLRSVAFEPADHVAGALRRYRRDYERRLVALERVSLPDRLVERIRVEVQPILETLNTADLSFQHSDFGPWNLLADRSGCLWVIDLHNATVGHRSYDEAFFQTALDLLTRYRTLSGRTILEARRRFSQRLSATGKAPRPSDREDVDTLTRFSIFHMAYFGAGLGVQAGRRDLVWFPRPLEPFLRTWFERRLKSLG
jgi:hypothetical protein